MQPRPSTTPAAFLSHMVQASAHVDALTTVVDLLVFVLVGLVVDCEPFTAEHEVVDSISDFGREG